MALSEDSIVRTAFDLLNSEGLESVSLRNIAARLGVKAPSLSWHVKTKDTLLARMKFELFTEALAAIPECSNRRDWLLEYGLALWRVEQSYRDSARLIASGGPSPDLDQKYVDLLTQALEKQALNTDSGMQMQAGVQSYVIGWNLLLQSSSGVLPRQRYDAPEAFELGLRALIDGYAL